eukprot:SAG11_NODE_637_length_8033_cov_4.585707_10_plen_120_part_00
MKQGNGTERGRIGKLDAVHEVVLDLYAGIGNGEFCCKVLNDIVSPFQIMFGQFSAISKPGRVVVHRTVFCDSCIHLSLLADVPPGYFTLPLLVHAKVAHVHACELNPDSVAALRRGEPR